MADEGISRRDLFRRLGAPGRAAARATSRSGIEGTPSASSEARSRNRSFPLHRPPGAIGEEAFLAACTSCGECATACPHGAIVTAPDRLRRGARTPTIVPLIAACQMCPDTPCITACEPRALRPEQPLRMAEARIQPWACLAHQGTFCSVCRERCPVPGAIELAGGKPIIVDDLCTGCGVCQFVCPAPENAILLMPLAVRPTVLSTSDGNSEPPPAAGSDSTP